MVIKKNAITGQHGKGLRTQDNNLLIPPCKNSFKRLQLSLKRDFTLDPKVLRVNCSCKCACNKGTKTGYSLGTVPNKKCLQNSK